MKRIITILTVFGSFLIAVGVTAQGGPLKMGEWVVGAGGGRSSGANFTVEGTSGQPTTGVLQGGAFTIHGGFGAMVNPPPILALHLPLITKQDAPIVTPVVTPIATPVWQRVGAGGLTVSSLAVQNDQLFAADRRDFEKNGGLYKRSIAACESTLTLGLVRIETIAAPGYSIVFQGAQGVLATHKNDIFYSPDNGNTWTQTVTPVKDSRTVAATAPNVFYAGSNTTGIYRSNDGGVTWEQRNPNPAEISVLRLDTIDPNILWVGTENKGVQILTLSLDRLSQRDSGLTTADSKKVWDFDFDSAGNIYAATYGGVFKWDGAAWQPFGLQGVVQARSLAVVGDQLYAGAQLVQNQSTVAGVWRRPLNGGDWVQVTSAGWNPNYTVRDLLYDSIQCKGLLAATEDGVWVYK